MDIDNVTVPTSLPTMEDITGAFSEAGLSQAQSNKILKGLAVKGVNPPTRKEVEGKMSLADLGITGESVFNGTLEGGKFVAKTAVVAGGVLLTFYIGLRLYQAVLLEDEEVLIDEGL